VGLAAGAIALGAIIGAVVALTGNDDTTTPPPPITSPATVTTPARTVIAPPITNGDENRGDHNGDEDQDE